MPDAGSGAASTSGAASSTSASEAKASSKARSACSLDLGSCAVVSGPVGTFWPIPLCKWSSSDATQAWNWEPGAYEAHKLN